MKPNKIHSTVIIEGDVQLGEGNVIHPYSVLIGPLKIGNDNIIGPSVVIGSPGQDTRNPRYDSSRCQIVIGNQNIIREFTAIQKPCYEDITQIGNECYLMQSVHIPHDAILEDNVVLTPMVAMGGIVRLLEGANIALGASIHQRCVIGQFSIVAAGAVVLKNVKPFSRYIPGKEISVNHYAIEKFGWNRFSDEISDYVLKNTTPTSPKLKTLLSKYTNLHLQSKMQEY